MYRKMSNEIETIDKEKMMVTCIERKYRVEKKTATFIITAKTELDEDTTSRLLLEDMELKTFLARYEITDIILSAKDSNIIHDSIQNSKKSPARKKETWVSRRSLFDQLDLPDEFISKDYADAIVKQGFNITNKSLASDDLKYFIRIGKLKKLKKNINGAQIYKLVKNDKIKNNIIT